MLLAFDIGNSSVSIGVFELFRDSSHKLLASFKISNKPYSADEYTLHIKDFLTRSGFSTDPKDKESGITSAVISSVVPRLTDIIKECAYKITGKSPFIVSGGTKTGFGIKIKNPEELGADIVCNVAASLHLSKSPLAILDMGTATTITVVDSKNNILGGIITPGLALSMNALTDSAALLSTVRIENYGILIGRDTEECINSGVINGNVYMIDGFIRNIRDAVVDKESGEKLSLIATGGLVKNIIPYTKHKFTYYENLTLEGCAYLYSKNVRI